jgi:flagellar hook protein FlgE
MDLAIQGDAFFLLSDGSRDYYSRAGNLRVDADGNLVGAHNGFMVQGRMADSNGVIQSSAPIGNMTLPFGQKAPAKATELIQFSCNLDSTTNAKAQVLSADFSNYASVTSSALTAPLDLTTNNELSITVDDDSGSTLTKTLTLTADTYSSVSEVVAEINAQISSNRYLSGEVLAEVVQSGTDEMIKIRTTDTGGSNTELTLSGTATTPLSFSTTRVTGTTAASSLNDLPFVAEDITDGDEIWLSGSNPDGSTVSATYTYATGDTVQELLDAINTNFSGTTATLETDGSLITTDAVAGDSETNIDLTFVDSGSDSVVRMPSFIEQVTGEDAGSHTASILVYDSKGDTHNVAIEFTNVSSQDEPDSWRWEAIINNGEISPVGGNKGFVKFNADGSLASFETDDGIPLTFEPANGAETLRIRLDPGTVGSYNGITQLSSPTTTVARHQDGYGMGNLYNISFDDTGTITGNFTNGVNLILGQIALVTFNNPAGLERTSNNLYEVGVNSGTAVKGFAGTTIQATIASGALEMSNVDLAQEFTNMIVAQRGFQANARVITTSDTLLDEIVRLKR